jgi:predicted AlkP superfamily pyrophosphatase or phosphodiesterase
VYDHDLSNPARVDQVLEWLKVPDPGRPTFLTLYFSSVDTAGHDTGPESPEVRAAISDVDSAIERLVSGIAAAGLTARTNLILVSDHGMAELSPARTIVLDDYLDLQTVDLIDSSPIVGLNARSGSAESIFRLLKDKHASLAVYTRDSLPVEFRLRGHPRLPDVIGIAEDGWHVTTRAWLDREAQGPGGMHGYDPRKRSMHGLFIAVGPRFRSGTRVPAFENVHVYELICKVLGLQPASNDGSLAETAAILR